MLRATVLFRRFCLLATCGAVALATLTALPARAQDNPDPVKEARKLFQQGLELEQAGNWSGALRNFREVSQVKMTPQVRFHIAVCEENLGKLVAALGGYELALADADSVGESFRAEVEDKIAKLRVRIPKLAIERGDGAEAATIELDGIVLGASSIGVEVPVDPGPHVVVAKADGYGDFSTTVTIAEESVETVSVTLTKEPARSRPRADAPPVADHPTAEPNAFPIVPVALIGGGGALLLGSGGMLIMRSVALNDYRAICKNDLCPNEQALTQAEKDDIARRHQRVATYGTISLVLAGLGVASAGTGVILLVKDGGDSETAASTRSRDGRWVGVAPIADVDGFGLSVSGRF